MSYGIVALEPVMMDAKRVGIDSANGLHVNNTTCGIYSGSGSPEAAVTADIGSIYLRSDGGDNTALYVKESGTGNTGWGAVTAA